MSTQANEANWIADDSSLLRSFLPLTIRAARVNANLRPAEVAFRMNVPRTYISKLECGRCLPSLESLESFGKAVGVPMWRLVRHAQNLAAKHDTRTASTQDQKS